MIENTNEKIKSLQQQIEEFKIEIDTLQAALKYQSEEKEKWFSSSHRFLADSRKTEARTNKILDDQFRYQADLEAIIKNLMNEEEAKEKIKQLKNKHFYS